MGRSGNAGNIGRPLPWRRVGRLRARLDLCVIGQRFHHGYGEPGRSLGAATADHVRGQTCCDQDHQGAGGRFGIRVSEIHTVVDLLPGEGRTAAHGGQGLREAVEADIDSVKDVGRTQRRRGRIIEDQPLPVAASKSVAPIDRRPSGVKDEIASYPGIDR